MHMATDRCGADASVTRSGSYGLAPSVHSATTHTLSHAAKYGPRHLAGRPESVRTSANAVLLDGKSTEIRTHSEDVHVRSGEASQSAGGP